jgi:hypothetical protein
MTEAEKLLHDWKVVYGETHPAREPDGMQYTDAMLALGVLLRREARMSTGRTAPALPDRITVRGRILDRLSSHDPSDPE